MKNYSNIKPTLTREIDETAKFTRCADLVGRFEEGVLTIHGYFKNKSKKYNKDQYSLYVIRHIKNKEDHLLLNVPGWYGEKLEQDFLASGQTAEEFFEGNSIAEIESFETKFGTDSYNIIIW